jgi:hypothetical protein
MCLRFQFCTHQRVCILYFLKKSQIRCTLGSTELVQHLEGEFTIGARALLDINLIWFGYINACHNVEVLVQKISICRRADSQRQDEGGGVSAPCVFASPSKVFLPLSIKTRLLHGENKLVSWTKSNILHKKIFSKLVTFLQTSKA